MQVQNSESKMGNMDPIDSDDWTNKVPDSLFKYSVYSSSVLTTILGPLLGSISRRSSLIWLYKMVILPAILASVSPYISYTIIPYLITLLVRFSYKCCLPANKLGIGGLI